jgi:lipopolysaccharide export system permease protein
MAILKKLDTYIIGKYLSTIFFVVLIFSLISIVIDFSEHLSNFTKHKLSAWYVITHYYAVFVFAINGLLLPLYALIAVVFFTSRMASNSEIISIFNAGASFNRLLRPYLVASGLVALLHLTLNHFVIPEGNGVRVKFVNSYIDRNPDTGQSFRVHLFVSPTSKIYVERFNKQDSTGSNFTLESFKDNKITSILNARTVRWKAPPHLWTLEDYNIHTFDSLKETIVSGIKMDSSINFTPQDFVSLNLSQEAMNSLDLQRHIDRQRARGAGGFERYQIELHRRTADAVSIIILSIIGLAIAARKVRGGMGLHLAFGVAIGAIFIVLMQFSATFVTNGNMNPLLGVWIPNIIFSVVAVWLVARAQK